MHLFRCALLLAACHTTIFAADGTFPDTIRVGAEETINWFQHAVGLGGVDADGDGEITIGGKNGGVAGGQQESATK